MASQDPIDSFAEFIDDYYSECEEHLIAARQSLLALDAFVDHDSIDRSLLDDLFRSFHSIKGLSAMVGVTAAERLAHEMESYLTLLRQGQTRLEADGLDLLIAGVKTLEEVILARRSNAKPPAVDGLLSQLATLTSQQTEQPNKVAEQSPPATGEAQQLPPDRQERLTKALAAGGRAWLFTFTPSVELSGRGINVNVIRQRLEKSGDVIQAAPLVRPGGQIAFTFLVASSVDEASFAEWRDDGVVHEPYQLPPVPVRPPEARPTGPVAGSNVAATNLVRVDLSRLDELMRLVGELVISRARLDDNLKRLNLSPLEARGLQETNAALERQLRDLREGVMRVRMVPVRELFARMQFVVRDLTREHRKKVVLDMTGQETEIDKFVIERMIDPLLHLVRNAVSHALEPAEERTRLGKPPEGHIALRARTTGETITMEVEDDGRGIDPQRVYARARSVGLITADAPADPAALLDILCAPGFSTRDEADRVSGRGVGMAVVRAVVEELGGSLALRTEIGRGSCFTIQLPLTLAIADALIVLVAGERYAVPQVSVREVIEIEKSAVTALENNEIIYNRGGVLPLLRLSTFFRALGQTNPGRYALVTGEGLNAVGLVVDRVLGLREVVVRPLTDALVRVPGISGATELGDGQVVLILDATGLSRAARHQGKRTKSELLGGPIVAAS